MRRGDIYVAAVRGAYTAKPRPVVIVQDDRFDATVSVMVCPLTTDPVQAPADPNHGRTQRRDANRTPISIMVDKITTMPRDNVRDRLGRITDADVIRLDRALLVFLGLAE